MRGTLFSKVFGIFLGGCILIIAFFSFMVFSLMESGFENYLNDRFFSERDELISNIEEAYLGNDQWNADMVASIEWSAMHSQMVMTVVDTEGNNIREDSPYMSEHIQLMQENQLLHDEEWSEETINLSSEDEYIATVYLSYPNSHHYTSAEEVFLRELTFWIIVAGIIAVIIASIAAYVVSKRISKPIVETSEFTQMIAEGDYKKRINQVEQINELNRLQLSINQLAKQLDEQRTIRNQMVSDLSHEIRTPLTTLQGNIEAMIDGIWEVTPERLSTLNMQVKRLSYLVQSIHQLDDLESIPNHLDLKKFNLTILVKKIKDAFELQASQKNITISVDGKSINIYADYNQMNQVISNLLENAVKFTPKGGSILLKIMQKKDKVQLSISDTGIGIPKEKQERIFDRFYQIESSRNSEIKGQGIGLAIVKSIIYSHGGRVFVESEVDVGTTITIELPAKREGINDN
jgi:signal transduction histidine kinase